MLKNPEQLKLIIQAALMTAGKPLNIDQLLVLFADDEKPSRDDIRETLAAIETDFQDTGVELKQVSSGYRLQIVEELSLWINRMSEEKPSRYSRALLETIALIAYRQPITRAGVEDVRGVSVSTSIIKTLLEREWVKVVGHRDVPGKPALYGTTRDFLDSFNLKSLSELPPLAEIRSIEEIQNEFELQFAKAQQSNSDAEPSTENQIDSDHEPEPEPELEPKTGHPTQEVQDRDNAQDIEQTQETEIENIELAEEKSLDVIEDENEENTKLSINNV